MIRTATVAQAATARSLRSASFLDVRNADEYAAGHVDGAVFMPLHVVPLRTSELSRTDTYFVICAAGARSAQATAYLAASHGWVGGLGGALFVLSDGLIALGAFRPELVDWPRRDLVVMATYVAAQALFVAVVLRTRPPGRAVTR